MALIENLTGGPLEGLLARQRRVEVPFEVIEGVGPHTSLGFQPPAGFAAAVAGERLCTDGEKTLNPILTLGHPPSPRTNDPRLWREG